MSAKMQNPSHCRWTMPDSDLKRGGREEKEGGVLAATAAAAEAKEAGGEGNTEG